MEKVKSFFNKSKRVLFYIIIYVFALLVFVPCILIFNDVGHPNIWNFVGLAYLLLLYYIFKKLS